MQKMEREKNGVIQTADVHDKEVINWSKAGWLRAGTLSKSSGETKTIPASTAATSAASVLRKKKKAVKKRKS